MIKDYSNSVIYADKVLSNPKTDDNVKSDAQIIIARSAMQTGDETKARSGYTKLLTIAKGELAAEALYYDAYFKKMGSLRLQIQQFKKLAKNIQVTDILVPRFNSNGQEFLRLKDSFQATYILDNVIENFTDFPDVISEAKKNWMPLKRKSLKTNSSIVK
jgi:hypothetical protein